MEQAQKLTIAKEITAVIVAAKSGITIADAIALIEKIADAATKFAEPRQQGGGMFVTSVEEQHADIDKNLAELRAVLQVFDDAKYSLDELLSFEFELNEVPLSSFFRFMSEDTDKDTLYRVSEVCKHFPALKIGFARNVPKFDQTFIDAGAC